MRLARKSLAFARRIVTVLAWMALFGAVHAVHAQAHAADIEAVTAILKATWDKPDAKLEVEPVVVVEDHAVAGWTQGHRGGRALLRKTNDIWAVVLCSGEPLRHAAALIEAGVSVEVAERLARDLHQAEQKLPPAHVAMFATFEGVVHMDGTHGDGAHRPH